MTGAAPDPAERIVTLVAALESIPDRALRDQAADLVRSTMDLYGAGLAHLLELVRRAPSGATLVETLMRDPAVAAMMALHDLAPVPEPEARRDASAPSLVQIARRHRTEPASPQAGERCERCSGPIPQRHAHAVNAETRTLLCICTRCWTAMRDAASADDPVLAVPDRPAARHALDLSEAQWSALEIPVGLAFFLANGRSGRTSAFYPSPAGAVESLLPLHAWNELLAANPWTAAVATDVEAVIVRQARAGGAFDAAVLPIDACYDLIGRIRLRWTGFDGGDAVRREIDDFFAGISDGPAVGRSVEPGAGDVAWESFVNPPGIAAPEDEPVLVGGAWLRRDDRVRLAPRQRADAMDMFLAGRVAQIAGVYRDLEDRVHVAVTLADDPGADLQLALRRFMYFAPEELEALEPAAQAAHD